MAMTSDIQTIEKYRKSKPGRRTLLFLSYPRLRPDFLAIETTDYQRYRYASAVRSKKAPFWNRWRSR